MFQTASPEIVLADRYAVELTLTDTRARSAMRGIDLETGETIFAKSRSREFDKRATERIRNEADMLGSLDHPRIPGLRYADPDAERPFIVTDYTDREKTVESRFRQPGDFLLAATLVRSALGALEHVHDRRIAHCDIKPDNMPMTWDEAAVVDFDIARRIGDTATNELLFGEGGMQLATLEYASPEQLQGETDLDSRTDIYAMGQVLLYFLSGKRPVTAQNANQLAIRRQMSGYEGSDLNARRIPPALHAIVARALREQPDARYQEAGEMAEDLEQWERDNVPAGVEVLATAA
jgi:serine/threonine protein kinase